MELKPGYKLTEIGVIPYEWIVRTIGEIGSLKNGINRPSQDFGHGFPLINLMDVFGIPKLASSTEKLGLVASTEAEQQQFGLREGDVLFVRSSVKPTGVGLTTLIPGNLPATVFSGFLIRFRDNGGLTTEFKEHCFSSVDFRRRVIASSTVSANTNINQHALSRLQLAFPPSYDEQRAIAAALSDVDALLDGLERLIAKKRDLKQAAMQQLLTDKTRLPGFHGEWGVKRLGDIIERLVGGGTPSRGNPAFWGDGIPWVTVKDFASFHPSQTQESITRVGLNNSASHLIQAGTLITATRMALGKAVVYDVDVAINQDLKALYLKPSASVQFLRYWIQHNAQMIDDLGSGSTVKGISILELRNLPFPQLSLPKQNAIAAVLSDMDAELSTLEARHNKTRHLKQAMMQELLTGRIRLVGPARQSDKKLSPPARPRRANVHFRRSVLAAEIVDRLNEEPTFGHVKFEKVIFLVEHLCKVDTGSTYHRDAAGPYDNRAIRSIDKQLREQQWFDARHTNGRYRYLPMAKRGEHKLYFERYFGDIHASFDRVINRFRNVNTERCEIVATLFGAWNDLVHENAPISDEAILNEVLNKWHESKNRISEDRWRKALNWMRNNGFVPQEGARTNS